MAPPAVALIAAFARRCWGELLTLAAVIPIAAAAARAVRHGWMPVGDAGLLAVRARDVATAHHPLLGSWTSASLGAGIDLNNPGAAYDVLLAPIARIVPSYAGIAVAVAAVNVGAVVGASVTARAVGGRRLQSVILVACSLLVWSMGSELLIDIWQPHALLLPFLALLVLALGLSVGQTRWMPWAIGLGSLVVQTHVAYVYAIGAIAAAVTVLALRRTRGRRGEGLPSERWRRALTSRTALATGIVGLVVWAQPFYEQWAREGNLGRLVRAATSPRRGLGMEQAVRVVTAQVAQFPWRLRAGFSGFLPEQRIVDDRVVMGSGLIGPTAALLVLVGLVVVLGVLAVLRGRHGSPLAANGCWLCIALLSVGVYGTSTLDVRYTGLGEHQIRWLWTVLVFGTVVGAWALAGEARRWLAARRGEPAGSRRGLDRPAEARWAAAMAATVAVLALAAVPFHAQASGPTGDRWAQRPLRAVVDDLASFRPAGPVLYDLSTLRPYEPFSGPIMLALQSRGIEFRVGGETWARQLGPRRAATGREAVRIFQLQDAEAMAYDGPACLVALGSPGADVSLGEGRAALAAVVELNRRLLEGDLVLPLEGVEPADRWLLGEVRVGNAVAAAELVAGGTLGRVAARGEVVLDAGEREQLARAESLLRGLVALFADGPGVCPESAA